MAEDIKATPGTEATVTAGEEANKQVPIAISVKDLVISYRMMRKMSVQRSILSFTQKDKAANRFVAVKGVSFDVPQGEIVGLIGKNGSGKSTTLRAIAGILSPDSGSIDLHGNTISLLSIGVGFKPLLTGRENIILSGMLLGFSEKEIAEKTEAIIEFSELGEFIDYPVKTYSSGMYSKLAFSITAILETNIILIDEVLSVGDEKFKKKSYRKMKELINTPDRTVVIVSHSIKTLEELCTTVIWLHDGEIKMVGETKEVLKEYQEFMK